MDIQAEFFPVETTNALCDVGYVTMSIAGVPDDARRAAIDAAVRSEGGRTAWRCNAAAGRSYALIETAERFDSTAISLAAADAVYEMAIIALAVFPAVPEALPHLYDTFTGPGRPAAMLCGRACPGGIILEWDPQRTAAQVILELVELELRRFNSGRTAEVLAPVPAPVSAKIAADGLATPQIAPNRILELLIGR